MRPSTTPGSRYDFAEVNGCVGALPHGLGVQWPKIWRSPKERGPIAEHQTCYHTFKQRRTGCFPPNFDSANLQDASIREGWEFH